MKNLPTYDEFLNESVLINIPDNHSLKKDIESAFGTTFASYCFKFDKKNDLVGINIDYLSDDTGMDPNKITSLIRGLIRKNTDDYMEIKMGKGGVWPEKYEKTYPSLEELDPDYYMVIKLK